MVPLSQLLLAFTVFLARVADVSLGTFRQAMAIRGKKLYAFLLSFIESLIWIFAVSRVLSGVTEPLTAFAFALGFAMGTFVGISIEDLFKIGDQSVRVFTAEGHVVSTLLRERGYRVTSFEGTGRDGSVQLLFVQVRRREVAKICALSRMADPHCFLVVDDIRAATYGTPANGK
jgi:uncharacterized protein YebE (UPF0316 family)